MRPQICRASNTDTKVDDETADVHIVLASTNTSKYTNEKNNEIDIDSEEYLKDQQFSIVADKKCFKMTTTRKHQNLIFHIPLY